MICSVLIPPGTEAAELSSAVQSGKQQKLSQEQFVAEVRKNYEMEDFPALDEMAFQARTGKERFPGAEWKLYVFYQALAWPKAGEAATDQEWQFHLYRLQKWVDLASDSMTARVALAGAWVEYARKARTSVHVWTDFDKQIGGKQYQERIRQAEKALTFDPKKMMAAFLARLKREFFPRTSSQLRSYCPHWYVVKLAIEQSRSWEWNRYNNFFAEGVSLEPAYYYLYTSKAVDLLPQHHGVKSQWEIFADNSARSLGDDEGDILYYLIVAQVRPYFDNTLSRNNFFRVNVVSWPRLLAGYKKLEAKYGTTSARLNEIALMASLAKQQVAAKSFFDRIGENWDVAVWGQRAAFDEFRSLANKSPLPEKVETTTWVNGPITSITPVTEKAELFGLRATVSSRVAIYQRSRDIAIEVLVENLSHRNPPPATYELNVPALWLTILDARKGGKELTLLPQAGYAQQISRSLKPGELARFTYRIDEALPAGEYKIRMKTVRSNELLIRISPPQKRQSRSR
jgi:hypothetical protein